MLVDVVELRGAGGVRLRKDELNVPVRGDLVIEDHSGEHLSFKRPMRAAHLYQPRDSLQVPGNIDVLPPLFDAQVIKIEGDVITITGLRVAAVEPRRTAEYGQVWRCTVVAAPRGAR